MSDEAARPYFPAEDDVSRLKTIEEVGGRVLRRLPTWPTVDSRGRFIRSVARGIASAIRSQRGVVSLLGGHP